MLVKRMIGADEAKRAIDAAIREADMDGISMSFAVVDTYGEVIVAARMDGSAARVLRHAIRQAYTAGLMLRDTVEFKKQLVERDGNLDEWGDAMLTTLPGGVAILYEGEVVGAIGVGGNSLVRDQEIAAIAARTVAFDGSAQSRGS
jgi:glc operon protein GlcG